MVPCSMCNGGGVALFYRQGSDFTSYLVADGYECRVAPPRREAAAEVGELGFPPAGAAAVGSPMERAFRGTPCRT